MWRTCRGQAATEDRSAECARGGGAEVRSEDCDRKGFELVKLVRLEGWSLSAIAARDAALKMVSLALDALNGKCCVQRHLNFCCLSSG